MCAVLTPSCRDRELPRRPRVPAAPQRALAGRREQGGQSVLRVRGDARVLHARVVQGISWLSVCPYIVLLRFWGSHWCTPVSCCGVIGLEVSASGLNHLGVTADVPEMIRLARCYFRVTKNNITAAATGVRRCLTDSEGPSVLGRSCRSNATCVRPVDLGKCTSSLGFDTTPPRPPSGFGPHSWLPWNERPGYRQ